MNKDEKMIIEAYLNSKKVINEDHKEAMASWPALKMTVGDLLDKLETDQSNQELYQKIEEYLKSTQGDLQPTRPGGDVLTTGSGNMPPPPSNPQTYPA